MYSGKISMSREEKKLRDLLLKASRDREFRESLLIDPVRVGKKHDVTFSKKQLKSIKDAATLIETVKDIVFPYPKPGPVYPLPPILNKWMIDEILYMLDDRAHALIDPHPHVFYPIPWPYRRMRSRN